MNRYSLRTWVGASGLALLLSGAAVYASATYTVNLQSELNGLPVVIDTVEQSGGLILKLTNNSSQRIRCDLHFEAQPQTPRRRTVSIDPGVTRQVTHRAERRWFTVDVRVTCAASSGGAEAKS
jgi:hypothetical protein